MIIKENVIPVDEVDCKQFLETDEEVLPEEIIFFDLEHYVYKKPKCIGVFGACVYNVNNRSLEVTQYMIENRKEGLDILNLALKYFQKMKENGRRAISTFSGNNDFTVINYLFNKYNISYDFKEEFLSIDLQKAYERDVKTSIGLKKLEKIFDIDRQGEVISGSNLAKTFHKIMKDTDYIKRMPKEKIENILLYNEQDVVNLYCIYTNWKKYIVVKEEEEEETKEKVNIEEENLNIETLEDNEEEIVNEDNEEVEEIVSK
ncbi:ribonuclease H-like domain-containing protein [Clostridium sp.]|uniref:ribonuclease H-like domain-containing protein n=1 Tax=Clostridium sp. TaxID=1506 RepID=UPI002FCC8B38